MIFSNVPDQFGSQWKLSEKFQNKTCFNQFGKTMKPSISPHLSHDSRTKQFTFFNRAKAITRLLAFFFFDRLLHGLDERRLLLLLRATDVRRQRPEEHEVARPTPRGPPTSPRSSARCTRARAAPSPCPPRSSPAAGRRPPPPR